MFFIYIDKIDGTGGFIIPKENGSEEIIKELLKDPEYMLRKDGMKMEANDKGITQTDLDAIPEMDGKVLWQPDDDAPTVVTDLRGISWSIGFREGILSKRRMR